MFLGCEKAECIVKRVSDRHFDKLNYIFIFK